MSDLDDIEKRYPMLCVDWQDHTADGGWVDNPRSMNFEIARTVGWLVEEDEDCLKIANSLTKDSGIGGISVIIKSCIIDCWEIHFPDEMTGGADDKKRKRTSKKSG